VWLSVLLFSSDAILETEGRKMDEEKLTRRDALTAAGIGGLVAVAGTIPAKGAENKEKEGQSPPAQPVKGFLAQVIRLGSDSYVITKVGDSEPGVVELKAYPKGKDFEIVVEPQKPGLKPGGREAGCSWKAPCLCKCAECQALLGSCGNQSTG
jgi:hypothetical protein